ncbi:MAG: S41 family peptidase [Gemmataceae bacterium]
MPLRNLAWLLVVPALVLVGLAVTSSAPAPDKDYVLIRQVVDVLAEVDANYYRELSDDDRQKLVEDMINGGLSRLDPHSEYLNRKRLEEFKTSSEGSFGGVGIVLGVDADTHQLKVRNPMVGTPAYEAGVLANDLILKIDGTAIAPLPGKYSDPTERLEAERGAIEQAKKVIKGELGSQVTITLRRAGRIPADFDVSLVRSRIELHPVIGVNRKKEDPAKWEWFADPANKIALIRLKDTFSDLTTKELRAAIDEINAAGARGLILDLRDNPGGLLNEAIDVCNLFLSDGQKIVSTRNRHGSERSFSAKKDGTRFIPTEDNPRAMAVLVNRHSASASEIVASALQDHGRAVVVGERTFGKGSVQKLLYLNPDKTAAVKLTTETYWRPSGKNIHRRPDSKETDDWGVRPSDGLEVPTTELERVRYSYEIDRLDYVAGKPGFAGANPPLPPAPRGTDGRPLYDDSKPFEDRVLNKAIEVLRTKVK